MTSLRVGSFEPRTEAMGPGVRACLWVAGCSIGCIGCATPEFIPRDSGTERTVERACNAIDRAIDAHGIEGVSFSGGEPFEQAAALAEVARHVRARGLSVLSWSGYRHERLVSDRAPAGANALLAELDVLIDGAYVAAKMPGSGPLRGSSNQRIIRLTDRYAESDFTDRVLEARFGDDGKLVFTGVDDTGAMRTFLRLMGVSE